MVRLIERLTRVLFFLTVILGTFILFPQMMHSGTTVVTVGVISHCASNVRHAQTLTSAFRCVIFGFEMF